MMRKKKPARPAPKPRPDLSYIADPLRALAEPLATLLPDPANARSHDEDNLRSIVASLRQFGQRKPIVVNSRTKTIEAGNGTFEAARRIGWTHLAVVWVEDDPAAARGFSIADNRTAELADWDGLKLETLLAELADDLPQLYDELLLRDLREKTADEDPAGGDPSVQPVDDRFAVVIECADEAQQQTLYERFQEEGLTCRLLTL
jgi:ParB-like chromosome segregation protein Spo0J